MPIIFALSSSGNPSSMAGSMATSVSLESVAASLGGVCGAAVAGRLSDRGFGRALDRARNPRRGRPNGMFRGGRGGCPNVRIARMSALFAHTIHASARACDLSRRRHARREGGRSDASRASGDGAQRDATARNDAKD